MAEDDERKPVDPMSEIEILNVIANTAKMSFSLFKDLQEEGFDKADAFKLVAAYLHGVGGGKFS